MAGEKLLDGMVIPEHVAIILDGNGRWAKKHLLPRNAGHSAGSKNVETICRDAYDIGIKYLTIYAFSTENWKRPADEVEALMSLLRDYLKDCVKTANKNKMRVRVIGDKSGLDADIVERAEELEEATKDNTGLYLLIAINYGSRDEISRAVRGIVSDCENGRLSSSDVNEGLISDRLDTGDVPDPDLLIRTSGEERLSNFLLWQLAYSEFYFTDVLWPDFNRDELIKAIIKFNERDRRYGGVGDSK